MKLTKLTQIGGSVARSLVTYFDTKLAAIKDKLDTHNHDDRYYTESESDGRYQPKGSYAPLDHRQPWATIDNIPVYATRWPTAHEAGAFTQAECTAKYQPKGSYAAANHRQPWSTIDNIPVYATRWASKSEVGLGNYENTSRSTWGSVTINGLKGDYAGIYFSSKNVTLMMNETVQGVMHGTTWKWYFANGVLTVGTVPWARLSSVPTYATRWPNASEVGLGHVPNTVHTANPTASTVAVRDGSGDLQARLFRTSYANESRVTGAMAFRVNNTSDNFIRWCSNVAAIRAWLGAAAASHSHAWSQISGIPATASRWPNWNEIGGKPALPSKPVRIFHGETTSFKHGNRWKGKTVKLTMLLAMDGATHMSFDVMLTPTRQLYSYWAAETAGYGHGLYVSATEVYWVRANNRWKIYEIWEEVL